MPELTWSQMQEAAKSQGFEPHPIGTYNFEVTESEVKGGKNQILLRMVNLDGPYANRSVLNNLSPYKNNGEVNGMFFQQLAALGFPGDWPGWVQMEQIGFEQGLAWLAPQIVGHRVVAEINHRQWNGENRDNVKRMKPYGGPVLGGIPGAGAGTPSIPQVPQAPMPVAQPVAPAAAVPVPQAPTPVAPAIPQPESPTQVGAQQAPAPVAPAPTATVPMAAPQAVAAAAPLPAPEGMPTTQPVAAPVAAPVEQPPVPQTPVPPLPGVAPQAAVTPITAVPTPPEPQEGLAPPF